MLPTYGQEDKPPLPKVLDPKLRVEVVADGLKNPTTMEFLNSNTIFVLEKDNGTVRSIINGKLISKPLLDVDVANKWERGMLGIAIIGDNKTNQKQVLLYFTESFTGEGTDKCEKSTKCQFEKKSPSNRLYRFNLSENMTTLTNKTLLLNLPAFPGGSHNGGIITVDKNKNIYLIVGDISSRNSYVSNSYENQTIDGRGGILRIDINGNGIKYPLLDTIYPLNLYYAYGIRNSFGLALDPITGNLWDTENGPGYGDEINLVQPGFNSGWDKVQGFWIRDKYYGGPKFTNESELIDFNGNGQYRPPELTTWNFTLGLTSIIFMNSEKFGKNYMNDLFVGSAHFNGDIYHFDLTNNRTSLKLEKSLRDKIVNNYTELNEVIFGKNFGLVSDIKIGLDGYMYIVSLNKGTIYRILPN